MSECFPDKCERDRLLNGLASRHADLAAKDARIAELEAQSEARKSLAEESVKNFLAGCARAEQAEAQLAVAREALEPCAAWLKYAYGHVGSVTADKVKAHLPKIYAALQQTAPATDREAER